MTAAAVRPIERPKALGGRPLLQKELPHVIEDQQRKRAMQGALAVMAQVLAQEAHFAVGLIDQDQRIRINA